ncbi:MAG: MFS transporter, partial [Planctomycetales bacterium]|nr:MFS transporter [Planctomycetales bacterium]
QALRLAWLIVVALWPVALLNYLDRQMMAAMKTSMVADIGIVSDAQWGLALGVFKWVYGVLSPFAGFVGDRFSRRYVIGLSLLVWSAATWATGHVVTYEQLIWSRALMGISEAFYIPTALALITDYHRGPTRSFAVGIHQIAIYVGTILGGFAGYAADYGSWRTVFTWCGIVGVLYAVPLLIMLRDRKNTETASEGTVDQGVQRASLSTLFANRSYYLLVLYFTLPALAGWVIRDWGPDILKQKYDLGQGLAGISAVGYVQIASFIGAFCGGWLADRAMERTIRGRILVSAVGMTLFLPALVGIGWAPTLTIAVAFLFIFGIGWGFFDCNNMPILCQIVRPELRATGYGIMNLVSISCGGVADWIFGELRDRDVSLTIIFGVFAGVALLSVLIVLLIRPNPQLCQAEETAATS